jgi:hypothetical protein
MMISAMSAIAPAPQFKAPDRSVDRLKLDDAASIKLLALRTLKVVPTEAVLHDLGVNRQELTSFLEQPEVRRAIVAKTSELLLTGELGRLKANVALPTCVDALSSVVADEDAAPGARVSAASGISKIASANGNQARSVDSQSGATFHLVLNLGGDSQPVTIETEAIPHRADDEDE